MEKWNRTNRFDIQNKILMTNERRDLNLFRFNLVCFGFMAYQPLLVT